MQRFELTLPKTSPALDRMFKDAVGVGTLPPRLAAATLAYSLGTPESTDDLTRLHLFSPKGRVVRDRFFAANFEPTQKAFDLEPTDGAANIALQITPLADTTAQIATGLNQALTAELQPTALLQSLSQAANTESGIPDLRITITNGRMDLQLPRSQEPAPPVSDTNVANRMFQAVLSTQERVAAATAKYARLHTNPDSDLGRRQFTFERNDIGATIGEAGRDLVLSAAAAGISSATIHEGLSQFTSNQGLTAALLEMNPHDPTNLLLARRLLTGATEAFAAMALARRALTQEPTAIPQTILTNPDLDRAGIDFVSFSPPQGLRVVSVKSEVGTPVLNVEAPPNPRTTGEQYYTAVHQLHRAITKFGPRIRKELGLDSSTPIEPVLAIGPRGDNPAWVGILDAAAMNTSDLETAALEASASIPPLPGLPRQIDLGRAMVLNVELAIRGIRPIKPDDLSPDTEEASWRQLVTSQFRQQPQPAPVAPDLMGPATPDSAAAEGRTTDDAPDTPRTSNGVGDLVANRAQRINFMVQVLQGLFPQQNSLPDQITGGDITVRYPALKTTFFQSGPGEKVKPSRTAKKGRKQVEAYSLPEAIMLLAIHECKPGKGASGSNRDWKHLAKHLDEDLPAALEQLRREREDNRI